MKQTDMNIAALWMLLCLMMNIGLANAGETNLIGDIAILYDNERETALNVSLNATVDAVRHLKGTNDQCRIEISRKGPEGILAAPQSEQWKDNSSPVRSWSLEPEDDHFVLAITLNEARKCRVQLGGQKKHIWITLISRSKSDQSSFSLAKLKKQIAERQYDPAEKSIRQWLKLPKHPPVLLEYLGVVLERQRKFDDALEVYRDYIQKFTPDDPDQAAKNSSLQRVQARIAAIEAIQQQPQTALRKTSKDRQKGQPSKSQFYGTVSEYYRNYQLDLPGTGTQTVESSLTTDLDLRGRIRNDTHDTRLRASGGYRKELDADSTRNGRLSSLYIDTLLKRNNHRIKLGRFSGPVGVLGYMDGLDYAFPGWKGNNSKIHLIAGLPVASSHVTHPDSEAKLFGLNYEYQPFSPDWRNTAFFIQQQRAGLTERQAIGNEIRYHSKSWSALVYLDFDLYFKELNTIFGNANWEAGANDRMHASFDYRRSPTLTLSNAVIGQGVNRVDQLLDSGFSESELQELALDRTAISQSVAFGWDHTIDDSHSIAVNLDSWKISSTQASGGVSGFEGTDWEYSTEMQLQWRKLINDGDTHWWRLRYTQYTQSSLYSTSLSSRIPWHQHWMFRPTMKVDWRDLNAFGSETIYKPEFQTIYTPSRQWRWELTLGGELISSEQGAVTTKAKDYYLFFGLIYSF